MTFLPQQATANARFAPLKYACLSVKLKEVYKFQRKEILIQSTVYNVPTLKLRI